MSRWQYMKGVHELGQGCFAYLQPDGGWGWSKAGLIVDGYETLLVDTLFDLKLTWEMLDRMRAAVPAAARIDVLVNTHGNPDHWFGNQLAGAGEILAPEASMDDMRETSPNRLAVAIKNWRNLGDGGAFLHEVLGGFDLEGITMTLPTRTFTGELLVHIGAKEVHLVDLGPAHSKGDAIVVVPESRVVFTGDLVFGQVHPILWVGPVDNWIRACDYILELDVETVVPGHGPIGDKADVLAMKNYFEHLRTEAKERFEAGMEPEAAARDLPLGMFESWRDRERIVANVYALYREFRNDRTPIVPPAMFGAMHRYRRDIGSRK